MLEIENSEGQPIEGVELGTINTLYPQYGIAEVPLYFRVNGRLQKSNRKFVLLNGAGIADVSSRYRIVPAQEVENTVNEIASENGFVLFKKSGNQIYTTWKYLSEKPEYVIQDSSSEVKLGFQIRSSIDGSTGLSFDGFTFRTICTNGAIFGFKHLKGFSANVKHTQNLSLELIKQRFTPTIQFLTQIKQLYQSWQNEFINEVQVKNLLKLPVKYLPSSYFVHEHGKETEVNPSIYRTSVYDIYNEVTNVLSHTQDLEPRTEILYNYVLHTALLKR